jgi:CHAT domain-containing protein
MRIDADEARFFSLGPAAAIKIHVAAALEALRKRSEVELGKALSALAAYLVEPLMAGTDGSGPRPLILCPDGDLNLCPFAALPLGNGALIDAYEISYVSSAAALLEDVRQPTLGSPPKVFGAPDFELRPPVIEPSTPLAHAPEDSLRHMEPFSELPGAALEAERIAGLLGVSPLVGAQATTAAFLDVQGPSILHVASHGFYKSTVEAAPAPLVAGTSHEGDVLARCGIALAGCNVWLRDKRGETSVAPGMVTGREILYSDLIGTELVVISACDSGAGFASHGEGVIGLRHAFEAAGAGCLVTNLVRVSDGITVLLMEAFYTALLRGMRISQALREAQLKARRIFKHPSSWAGWMCSGGRDALSQACREQIAPQPGGGRFPSQ